MKIVQVYFKENASTSFNTGPYSFICQYDEVKKSDLVLCETKYGLNLGQVTKIVEPAEIYRNANILPKRSIISIVDTKDYYKNKELNSIEDKIEKLRARKQELLNQVAKSGEQLKLEF